MAKPPKEPPTKRPRRPTDLATIGARIFLARKAKKLTLETVGKACGVSPQAVGQWEKNEARPTVDKLERLAGVLEVTLAQLVNVNQPPANMTELADRLELATKAAEMIGHHRFELLTKTIAELSELRERLAATEAQLATLLRTETRAKAPPRHS